MWLLCCTFDQDLPGHNAAADYVAGGDYPVSIIIVNSESKIALNSSFDATFAGLYAVYGGGVRRADVARKLVAFARRFRRK